MSRKLRSRLSKGKLLYVTGFLWPNIMFPHNRTLDITTHALVHFEEDNSVSAIPVKKFIEPQHEAIEEGCNCTVRWGGNRRYHGTVLALGKQFTSF